MSIKIWELNPRKYPTTAVIDSNLQVLCERLNIVRKAWGKPMIVTSGLRSEKQQEELIKAGKSNAKKSKHLLGMAADIKDPNGELAAFLKANPKILEEACLWAEASEYTPGWLHLQSSPPNSGNRWFIP